MFDVWVNLYLQVAFCFPHFDFILSFQTFAFYYQ